MKVPIQYQMNKDEDMLTVVEKHKKLGDRVTKGEVLLQAESLKGVVDVEAPVDGVLVEMVDQVTRTEGVFGGWDAILGYIETEQTVSVEPVIPVTQKTESVQPASFMVRKRANELNVDINNIRGSGPDGAVIMDDLERPGERPIIDDFLGYHIEPLSNIRRAIAKNMELSWRCIPHAGSAVTLDFRGFLESTNERLCNEFIHTLNGDIEENRKKYLRFDVVVIEAIVEALMGDYRVLNSCFGCEHFDFQGIKTFDAVNLGVAFSHPSGLLVPVLKNLNESGYVAIADRLHTLYREVGVAKVGAVKFKNATFTFNNVGALGSEDGQSIIPHGQAAICTLHKLDRDKSSSMFGKAKLSLRFDHRVCDGKDAIGFLKYVKDRVESIVNRDFVEYLKQSFETE